MRKTKIVCTLGPASYDEGVVRKMIEAGMNVARINMSHSVPDQMRDFVKLLKKVREDMAVPLAIMIDTKGPEVRLGTFKEGSVILEEGQKFTLTNNIEVVGDKTIVAVNYDKLCKDVIPGNRILLNDGLTELIVEKVTKGNIECRVTIGGKVSNRKSLFLPGVKLTLPFLSEADKTDLKFACEMDADYVAASFVSYVKDVKEIREFLGQHGGGDIEIISKIESVMGLENLDGIIDESDGIMVARGDLGVEISIEKLPAIQKDMIKRATAKSKPVITATEMLESMIERLRPTRAEATDVANAVYDETTAVMLSGETAMGVDPVNVVKTMAKICLAAEATTNFVKRFKRIDLKIECVSDVISHGACNCAHELGAAAIGVGTQTGMTARMVSRFRPDAPILAITPFDKVFYKMGLYWGVVPTRAPAIVTTDDFFEKVKSRVVEKGLAKKGEKIVVTAGLPYQQSGTNLIKVIDL